MTKVMVAGGFDPIHEGHIEHFIAASKLGDYLIVSINTDADMVEKKGRCNIPIFWRVFFVLAALDRLKKMGLINVKYDVLITKGRGTQVEMLKEVKPDIFAKGGDRTPDNMPRDELDVCKEIGCKIVYGVGGRKVNSSSKINRGD